MTVTPLAVALALVGLAWGVLADRMSVRWPEHDEGFPAGRPVGWRTAVVALFGTVGLGALAGRFDGGLDLAIFAAYVLVLTLLLATDLDQRLLPDVLTLPMIPLAFLYALSGRDPLVGPALVPAVLAAVAIPAALYLPSLAFGPGAFGLGDVKLLVAVGLVSGAYRALVGVVSGVFLAGAVIVVLLLARRITLKSYVPFGPFLIVGALWAILLRT